MTDEQPQPTPAADEPQPTANVVAGDEAKPQLVQVPQRRDSEPAEEPQVVEMQMPFLELEFNNAKVNVIRNEESGDRTIVIGPVILMAKMSLNAEGARMFARELVGGIDLNTSLSDEDKATASKLVRV